MRIVLDTNVLIAAFISRGHCFDLLDHVARVHELFTSEYILAEYRTKLSEKFRIPEAMIESAVSLLLSRTVVVDAAPLPAPVCRDADDDPVLGTAVAAVADALVAGDADLLALRAYEGIVIISPSGFWAFEKERSRGG